jgi:hypothetical protein
MPLFNREVLAEVFWEGQSASYTPWWGQARWPNGLPEPSDETYQWPYPCLLEELDDYGELIQEYLLEAHDIEAAIIKYADMSSKETVCDTVENLDLISCDNILQLACFNEIRYS